MGNDVGWIFINNLMLVCAQQFDSLREDICQNAAVIKDYQSSGYFILCRHTMEQSHTEIRYLMLDARQSHFL